MNGRGEETEKSYLLRMFLQWISVVEGSGHRGDVNNEEGMKMHAVVKRKELE